MTREIPERKFWYHACRFLKVYGLAEPYVEVTVRLGERCPVCGKWETSP